ncbi:MAG TPA: gluconokinase [Atribacteraceae bacterium]|nr:gluconokinase [Atribacteraceae bacterium]
MSHDLTLTVDIGTSSCKVCVFDSQGMIRSSGKREYPILSSHPSFAEQDPRTIEAAIVEAVREAVAPHPFGAISAMAFDTMLHSFLLVDKAGEPLSPLVIWMDTRSAGEVEELRQDFAAQNLYARCGAPLHTIYHLPRLRWFRKNEKELLGRVGSIVSIKDWLLHRLTGTSGEDRSTASGTGLLNLSTLEYDPDILELVGLRENIFSPLCDPEFSAPLLKGAFSRAAGLRDGLPVVWGGGDGPLANLGEGVCRPGEMLVTVGSSGAVRMAVPGPVFDPHHRSWCYYLADGLYVGGGAINNGGIVYSWIRDLLGGGAEVTIDLHRPRPLFLPLLAGERSPHWNAYARGIFFGLSYFHNREALLQSALEGVGFQVRSIYDMLQEVMGEAQRVVLSGGFAISGPGRRVLTDILGRTVEVSGLPSASARGAFLLSRKALGEIRSLREVPAAFFPAREKEEPLSERKAFYDKLYAFYEKIYRQSVELFREFAEFGLG